MSPQIKKSVFGFRKYFEVASSDYKTINLS